MYLQTGGPVMKLQTKVQIGGSTIKVQTGGPVIEVETVVCTDRKCYEITDQSTVRTGGPSMKQETDRNRASCL